MKRSISWAFFVAFRYFHARRIKGGAASFLLAALGIAIGTAALVVVLGVMNGFQSGFIDSILEVDSHHLRISLSTENPEDLQTKILSDQVRSDPLVAAAVVFADFETVALGPSGRAYPLRVKALTSDAGRQDPALRQRLGLGKGEFPGAPAGEIVLGAELARQLDVFPGDVIRLLTIRASETEGVEASTVQVRVAEIFRSGYYAFDYGLGFVSFETARAFGGPVSLILGVKLRDRFEDEKSADRVSVRYGVPSDKIITWRTYNRSFRRVENGKNRHDAVGWLDFPGCGCKHFPFSSSNGLRKDGRYRRTKSTRRLRPYGSFHLYFRRPRDGFPRRFLRTGDRAGPSGQCKRNLFGRRGLGQRCASPGKRYFPGWKRRRFSGLFSDLFLPAEDTRPRGFRGDSIHVRRGRRQRGCCRLGGFPPGADIPARGGFEE